MSTRPGRTVLIVDDSPEDRAMIRRLLQKHGADYTVHEVETGEQGLERCRTEQPDCVLLDFNLPDMTGNEFLEALHSGPSDGPSCPVALITGEEAQDVAIEALNRGAQDYVVKGTLNGPGLVRLVENSIEKFTIRRELEEKRAALELRNWELETVRDELQARLIELAEATRTKDQFLAVMSHEMRTPLNAILGYTDLLEMGIGGALSDSQRVHIDRIRIGGRHLLDLINDVLDLARADARKLELDLRPVDLLAVLEEVVALLESQAGAKELELKLDPGEAELPHVMADVQRLRQVITNLVGNAIKFTEEGSVTIRCEPTDNGTIKVRIVDTGIGIAPEVLPLVFTEFYQVEGDLTRAYGGSGLGLAISQRLAKLMGGELRAESRLGKGSVFTLALPAATEGSELRGADVEAHAARMDEHEATARGQAAQAPAVVVAFGDREDALVQLEQRVQPGVRLIWTTDVDGVPELASRERAALVVLDVSSADGAAWRAAHALQEMPELASTAVLLLPGIPVSDVDDAVQGLDLGWVSLVPKPFTADQLTHAVSQATRGMADSGPAPGGAPRCRVLVVDDDPDSRRVAANFLSRTHAEVREAADGESALLAMRRHAPDVVVLDLMMPVLDGFGVLAAMRADPLLAGIPVVVLSAKTLTDAERQFLARTAARVLQKGEHRLADVAALVLRAAARAADTVPES